jgi:uncharacterized surface anchored protein
VPETYTPNPTWQDGAAGGTAITAAKLNNIESGLETIDDRLTSVEDTAAVVTADVKTGSYTLVLTDAGKVIEMNSASAMVLTVPTNATVAFPTGTVLEVARINTGAVTLTPAAGVTLNPPSGSPLTLRVRYSAVSLRKRGTDEWLVSGDLG